MAAANIERAGLAGLIKINVGPALDGLRALIDERAGPFDLVFIDADKQRTPEYFELALELTRPGSVIVDRQRRPRGRARRRRQRRTRACRACAAFTSCSHADRAGARRVSATTIQTVGAKGYDGFTLALVER